nr:PREDICTED: caspase-14-like isoform X2 [Lepisosteus oculatus]
MPATVTCCVVFAVVCIVALGVLLAANASMIHENNTYHMPGFSPFDNEDERKKKKPEKSNPTQYDMSRRRVALLLCIKKDRPGAEKDLLVMRSLFKIHKFQVTEMIDLKQQEVIPKITEFRDGLNGSSEDLSCCWVVIMAHGRFGNIVAADGKSVKLEDIFKLFNNRQCPGLRQKPRAFTVQACRGVYKSSIRSQTDAADVKVEEDNVRMPSDSDTLFVYATPPGKVAYRNPHCGSPLFVEMEKVFMEHAATCHLYELFTKVNKSLDDVDLKDIQDDKSATVTVNAPIARSLPSKQTDDSVLRYRPKPQGLLNAKMPVVTSMARTNEPQEAKMVDRADGRLTLHIQSTLTKKWYLK